VRGMTNFMKTQWSTKYTKDQIKKLLPGVKIDQMSL
jgi:hypothetical protein